LSIIFVRFMRKTLMSFMIVFHEHDIMMIWHVKMGSCCCKQAKNSKSSLLLHSQCYFCCCEKNQHLFSYIVIKFLKYAERSFLFPLSLNIGLHSSIQWIKILHIAIPDLVNCFSWLTVVLIFILSINTL